MFYHPSIALFTRCRIAGVNGGYTQLVTSSRIQRTIATEYVFSLKDWIDKIAQYEAVLSLHREKLFDSTAYYRYQPVCEYYIFTLRRILI